MYFKNRIEAYNEITVKLYENYKLIDVFDEDDEYKIDLENILTTPMHILERYIKIYIEKIYTNYCCRTEYNIGCEHIDVYIILNEKKINIYEIDIDETPMEIIFPFDINIFKGNIKYKNRMDKLNAIKQ